jgi:hypothetical protein
MQQKERALREALRSLDLNEIRAFNRQFDEFLIQTYTWDIWAAAHVILDGCGDDSFHDFRSALISNGPTVYNIAQTDPDSLAEVDLDLSSLSYEGFGSAAARVWQEIVGKEIPAYDAPKYPKAPRGRPFKAWGLSKRLSKLAAKYGYKDAHYEIERIRGKAERKKRTFADETAEVVLNFQIIASSGHIPPYKILAAILNSGSPPFPPISPQHWKPITLEEGIYWAVIGQLERLTPDELKPYPYIEAAKLQQDFAGSSCPDFTSWIDNVRARS